MEGVLKLNSWCKRELLKGLSDNPIGKKKGEWEGGAGFGLEVSRNDNFMSSVSLTARQFIFSSTGNTYQAQDVGLPELQFLEEALFWKFLI